MRRVHPVVSFYKINIFDKLSLDQLDRFSPVVHRSNATICLANFVSLGSLNRLYVCKVCRQQVLDLSYLNYDYYVILND